MVARRTANGSSRLSKNCLLQWLACLGRQSTTGLPTDCAELEGARQERNGGAALACGNRLGRGSLLGALTQSQAGNDSISIAGIIGGSWRI